MVILWLTLLGPEVGVAVVGEVHGAQPDRFQVNTAAHFTDNLAGLLGHFGRSLKTDYIQFKKGKRY